MRNLGRQLRVLVSVGAIALISAAAAIAPAVIAKQGHPKPNLVVANAKASGPDHAFKGFSETVSFEDVTKNKGTATAGRSVTAYKLVAEFSTRHREYRVGSRRVPKLRPGDADRGSASKTINTSRLPLGAYELQICADDNAQVRESSERNCASTGQEFFVAKATWEGSISGVGGCCGAAKAEKWHSNAGDQLVFSKYLGDGAFRYDFNGIMHWTVSGVNQGGCTLSGSGSKAVDEDNTKPGITLKYGNARYLGTETLDQAFFTIFFTGGGGFPCSGMDQGPKNLDFLQINRHALVFAQNELKGRYDFGGAEGAAWKWDFK